MKSIRNIAALAALTIATLFTSCSSSGDPNYRPADTTSTPFALQNIYTRTSIRQFSGASIPNDTIQLLLRAGMAAPSAMNKQPWRFVVVSNASLRHRIGEELSNVGVDKMDKAAVAIVVCGDTTVTTGSGAEFWVQDCSAASENILLAANACRLGAVWCGVYPDAERVNKLRDILNLPSNIVPLNVIPVGRPLAGVNNPKEKFNPDYIINL